MTESIDSFLYPKYNYVGQSTPDNWQFNSNLQKFSIKLDIICNLETGGQIKTEEAYKQIKKLCEGLHPIHE
jgi:hypothetical protein